MEKKELVVALLLLSGCDSVRKVCCEKTVNDETVRLEIVSKNNIISSISVNKELKLPYSFVNDKDRFNVFLESIDEEYSLNGNILSITYDERIDNKYNLILTLDELAKECFYCA